MRRCSCLTPDRVSDAPMCYRCGGILPVGRAYRALTPAELAQYRRAARAAAIIDARSRAASWRA